MINLILGSIAVFLAMSNEKGFARNMYIFAALLNFGVFLLYALGR